MMGKVAELLGRWMHVIMAGCVVLMLATLSWGIAQSSLLMTMLAGAMLALIIVLGGSVVLVPDSLRSQATERTLRVASSMLQYMSGGLTPANCSAVCQVLLPETTAEAIALTDTQVVLAYVGDSDPVSPPGAPNTPVTLDVLKSGRMETFSARDKSYTILEGFPMDEDYPSPEAQEGMPVVVIVPLTVAERSVGTLKLYYRSGQLIDRTQLTIARGFAMLLSAQLSAFELDLQAELTARAEVKALQAQINPHFLFNTLNTIAAFTRTDPTRARDLLREFSVFYRSTLENSESKISLSKELEQTRHYLTIEKARFGEYRIVETEQVQPGLEDVLVPPFSVQPIVENAVRHAMRDEGPLNIDVHVVVEGSDVLVSVADDGLGMDDEVAARLLAETLPAVDSKKGTGIALKNVADRIELFYGVGSGIEVVSKLGEGTVVTLRLADAAPIDLREPYMQDAII